MPSLWSNLITVSNLGLKGTSVSFNKNHTVVQLLEKHTIMSAIYLE